MAAALPRQEFHHDIDLREIREATAAQPRFAGGPIA